MVVAVSLRRTIEALEKYVASKEGRSFPCETGRAPPGDASSASASTSANRLIGGLADALVPVKRSIHG